MPNRRPVDCDRYLERVTKPTRGPSVAADAIVRAPGISTDAPGADIGRRIKAFRRAQHRTFQPRRGGAVARVGTSSARVGWQRAGAAHHPRTIDHPHSARVAHARPRNADRTRLAREKGAALRRDEVADRRRDQHQTAIFGTWPRIALPLSGRRLGDQARDFLAGENRSALPGGCSRAFFHGCKPAQIPRRESRRKIFRS